VRVPVYLCLLHYPIVNRQGAIVTTAVTNLDLHDIARSSRTFGLKGYFVVTPIEEQHRLLGRILSHWHKPQSQEYHPKRFEALSLIRLTHDFEGVKQEILRKHGELPEVVLTDARRVRESVSYSQLRHELETSGRTRPLVIVFGTGWGVSDTFYPEVHRILAPVYGPEGDQESGGYNHLSVRAAAAIILDRLFGDRE
jgi:hypothetical protein